MKNREEIEKTLTSAREIIENSQKLRQEAQEHFKKILGSRYQNYQNQSTSKSS